VKKVRFTAQQHIEAGLALTEVRDRLTKLFVDASHSYAHSSKFVRELNKALKAVDEARHQGEEQAAKDCPKEWQVTWYYENGREK